MCSRISGPATGTSPRSSSELLVRRLVPVDQEIRAACGGDRDHLTSEARAVVGEKPGDERLRQPRGHRAIDGDRLRGPGENTGSDVPTDPRDRAVHTAVSAGETQKDRHGVFVRVIDIKGDPDRVADRFDGDVRDHG